MLTDQQKEKHNKLNTSLLYFLKASKLKIKHKILGILARFVLNQAQMHIHKEIQHQLKTTGKVRALIVKGRQQGCSTYVNGRYYQKTTRNKYKKTYILTHDNEATQNLFDMVQLMHESTEGPIQPDIDEDNRKRLKFEKLGSEYQVGTAGNKSGGRSSTIDYFHGSEVAHWRNTDGIRSGVMQAIRTGPGSEVILESTANGIGGMFHEMCMDALANKGEYILIFVPWYWQKEYVVDIEPRGFEMEDEDIEYMRTYKLSIEQMWWRFNKEIELKSKSLFKQEYPATVMEAFQSSGDNLITAEAITNARKNTDTDKNAPLVLGVDPARKKDRAAIAFRRGREIFKVVKVKKTNDDMRLVGIIGNYINKYDPVKVNIDCTNSYAIYDRLCELKFGNVVNAVMFSAKAFEPDVYLNKRAEMWDTLRDWLEDGGKNIPDSDEIQRDLAAIPELVSTSSMRKKLVSKDEIKKELGYSPDLGDAMALTFAVPVSNLLGNQRRITIKRKGGLKSKRRNF